MTSLQTYKIQPNETLSDGDLATQEPIKQKPYGKVRITINGVLISVGDGVKNEASYFSNDNGKTARLLNDIQIGDRLFWNGSIAGYQLDTSDNLRFDYNIETPIQDKKWYNKSLVIIMGILSVVGLILGILADGFDVWEKFK